MMHAKPIFLAAAALCATAVFSSFAIPSAAAQVSGQVPREATQKRPLGQIEPPRLNLPNFIGEGTGAARVWLTPMLETRSLEQDPPDGVAGPSPSADDDGPVIQLPSPFPIPNVPGTGPGAVERGAAARYIEAITVVNTNRNTAVDIVAECYNRDGERRPAYSHRANVPARAIHSWTPMHYRGTGDGLGELPAVFWCVISATAPVVAHARTLGGDYIAFTVGAK